MSEHLSYIEVEWTNAVALLESKMCIAGSFANYIQRSTLALGYLADVVEVLFQLTWPADPWS